MTLYGPLVWPLATLLIALIFRKDVGQALGRVGQVKYRDLELTFREDLHQAEQLARSIPPPAEKGPVVLEVSVDGPEPLRGRLIAPPSGPEGSPSDRSDSPEDLAGRRPRQAVEAAWGLVSRAISKHERASGRAHAGFAPLVDLLQKLRDRASRPDQPPPSPDDARRFVALARRVAERIEELG